MKLRVLPIPVPASPCGDNAVLSAPEAGRDDSGMGATVLAVNGRVLWSDYAHLSSADGRSAWVARAVSHTGIDAATLDASLLNLVPLVDGALRTMPVVSDWPPPVPLETVQALPALPVFNLFPKWAADYLDALATFTQTPVDLGGMLWLAAVAAAVQRHAVVEIRPGYREPLCLYVLSAMDSGERKSAVHRAITAPIRVYERELIAKNADAIIAKEGERAVIEQQLKDAKRNGQPDDIRDLTAKLAACTVPAEPCLLVQDSTPEHLVATMAEQNGALAAFDSEGGLLDTLTGRYGDSGVWLDPLLKAHAGDEIRTGRISRGKSIITDPVLTLGLAAQLEVVRGLAEKPGAKGKGLLGRFCYNLPASMKGRRLIEPPTIPPEIDEAYQAHMMSLLRISTGLPGTERTVVPFAQEAYSGFTAFAEWLEPQLAPGADLAGTNGWAEKLPGQVARIAACLHLASGEFPNVQLARPVSEDAMAATAAFVLDYLIPHGRAALHMMGADPAIAAARTILAWITRNQREEFRQADAYRDLRRSFDRPEALAPALQTLVQHGFIREIPPEPRSGAGRTPSRGYQAHPSLIQQEG